MPPWNEEEQPSSNATKCDDDNLFGRECGCETNNTCVDAAQYLVRKAAECALKEERTLCTDLFCPWGVKKGCATLDLRCEWWNETEGGCGSLERACREVFRDLECQEGERIHTFPTPTFSPLSYEWWYLLVLVPVVAGAVGNALVCLAVARDRRLQNVTNYFLTSLAIADLLVSLFVMPLGAIPGFLGYWPFGAVWCNVYVTCDVLACSSSIMHMCFVSVGRCIGIRHPLRSRLLDRRLTALKIAAAWLLSGAISSSITVLGAHDRTNIMPTPDVCTINNRAFFALGSIFAFYVPMVVMVVSYYLTVHLLRRQKAEFAEAAACDTTPPTRRSVSQRRMQQQPGRPRLQRSVGARRKEGFLPGRRRRTLAAATAVATEQKASKVLGLVFSTFVLCWAPFFLLNVAMAVSPMGNQEPLLASLAPLALWLGYVSSTINPLIYTAFNRTFRAAFLRLLRCDCSRAPAGRRPLPPRSPLSGGAVSAREESSMDGTTSSYRTWEECDPRGRRRGWPSLEEWPRRANSHRSTIGSSGGTLKEKRNGATEESGKGKEEEKT